MLKTPYSLKFVGPKKISDAVDLADDLADAPTTGATGGFARCDSRLSYITVMKKNLQSGIIFRKKKKRDLVMRCRLCQTQRVSPIIGDKKGHGGRQITISLFPWSKVHINVDVMRYTGFKIDVFGPKVGEVEKGQEAARY